MPPDDRIRWESDTTPAEWIAPRLHSFNQDTGSVIPEGFAAYCRIFHPVRVDGGGTKTWAELAAANGRVVHPEVQFHQISRPVGSPPPDRHEMPSELNWGECPVAIRETLVEVLRNETSTPDRCWFALWDGYGAIDYPPGLVTVNHPGRRYGLYGGPINFALVPLDDFVDSVSPNLWWPDDRAWVVATDIDYAWTYVGGSDALIQTLLTSDRIEALQVQLSDRPFYDGDAINAALDG